MFQTSTSSIARWSVAALTLIAFNGAASGSTIDRLTSADRIRQADLIVLANVTKVEHRNSLVFDAQRHVELPHSFVTIEIERTFKGEGPSSRSLTLRMQGGPDGRGRTLFVTGMPELKPGDRDIFFVKNNGTAACPLVGWEQGRLRVVRGEIYNEQGQEMWISPTGDFVFGEKALDVNLEGYPLRGKHDPEADSKQDADRFEPPAGALRADEAGFNYMLDVMVREFASRGEMDAPQPTLSVSIDEPFFVNHFLPRKAPTDLGVDGPLFRGDYDAREAEMVRRELKGLDAGDK